MVLINKYIFLSSSYNDGTFVFNDISDGKLQIGTGDSQLANGFFLGISFVGIANIPSSFDGKTVTVISYYSLRSTPGLAGVVIPNTIEEIHDYSIRTNQNLAFVNFSSPSSLRSIGGYSFRTLDILETFIVPSSVISIGPYAFANCPNLKNFYYCGHSDLRTISNCFYSSPLVTSVFVTSIYPNLTFASMPTSVTICPLNDPPSISESSSLHIYLEYTNCYPVLFYFSLPIIIISHFILFSFSM